MPEFIALKVCQVTVYFSVEYKRFLKRYPLETRSLLHNSSPMCLINLNYDKNFMSSSLDLQWSKNRHKNEAIFGCSAPVAFWVKNKNTNVALSYYKVPKLKTRAFAAQLGMDKIK